MIARTTVARIAACGALTVMLTLAPDGAAAVAGDEIRYRTLFQDPGEIPATDLALEEHAIALIDATPAGEHVGFAFRDFNRRPVADALIAAHRRGVLVDGVIDGGERTQPVVRELGPPSARIASCCAEASSAGSTRASRTSIPRACSTTSSSPSRGSATGAGTSCCRRR